MKRTAFTIAALACAVAANAALNMNLNVQYQTVNKPGTGIVLVTFSGTVDVLLPTFDATVATVEFPGNGSTYLSFAGWDAAFLNYLNTGGAGADYAGDFFSFEVASTTADGLYYLNGTYGGPLSEFFVEATDGVNVASDNEFFGVNVVPEPASIALLGLGAAALLRRRRK